MAGILLLRLKPFGQFKRNFHHLSFYSDWISREKCQHCCNIEFSNVPLKTLKHNLHFSYLVRDRHPASFNATPSICWKCNKELNNASLFCDSCTALQPFDKKTDFFVILGVNRTYRLNISQLKQNFLKLQTHLHPDKFTSKTKKEQELSEEFSSVVNKAYSTLLNPLERGLYMLSLHNISIEEGTTDVDKMFLMEIMERNEEIENESNPKKLNAYYEINKNQLDSLFKEVSEAFDANNVELAKKLLTKMKYYNTIEKKIKEIKQRLNIPD